MTERALPPPGWYPDSGLEGRVRWWDGAAWHQQWAEMPSRRGLGDSFATLGRTLRVILRLFAAVTGAMALHALWGMTTVADGLLQGNVGIGTRYDDIALGLLGLWLVLLVASAVVWCFWQHRLARAAEPGSLRRSPGMHVGSWFIPVVSLWFPFQNVRDLGRAWSVGWVRGTLGVWWTVWIVLEVTARALMLFEVDDPESFRTYNILAMGDAVLWLVVTFLALTIVGTLSRAALAAAEEEPSKPVGA